ncbi:MAG TPA: PQQ-like beta-propeller repeat protein [Planctomycetaceae bacterium]|nr:PQQ-like beta-propeller repeat protein [Planctomycetaceae bacterium]HQZ66994.1 PQQ-like beta-propeller repeat protein [Planctomycetaceae bacterium]
MVFKFSVLTLLACSVLFSSEAMSEDWPGWRGPNRDDISTETGLLKQWPEGGPEKLWTSKDAGLGYSGFSVANGVLFTMGADGADEESHEFVIAIDAKTGEKIWQTNVGQYLENGWGGGPRSTPTVSGDLLIAISGKGDVVCLSNTDGTEKWRVSMTELGGTIPSWGYCESALIDGDKVFVTPGGDKGTIACFNLNTGEKLWQSTDIKEPANYSSIIAVDHISKRQYIQLTAQKVFGFDGDGKLLWQHDFPGRIAVVATPIYKDGQVYVTAAYGTGCLLVNLTADNKVQKIYENKVMKNHHGGVLLVGDFLYGHSDSDGIICQDFNTGAAVWSDSKKGGSKGLTYADGMLYCIDEDSGDCFLVEANSTGYKEVSRFKLEPQTTQRNPMGRVWTHPVISNGCLYLRDQEIICCYKIK